MDLATAIKRIQDNLAQVTAILGSLGVLGGAAIKLRSYLSRSRLRIPNAFPLPEIPGEQAIFAEQLTELPTLLVGRETETRELARAVQNHRLTFLYGESGSGKSTVLKLGLARELRQSGKWIPIYLDSWGQDWVRGPQKSLADAADYALRALNLNKDDGKGEGKAVTEGTVFSRLAELRTGTGRRPILLFDQVDDYQNSHRDQFRNSENGLFLTATEVCAVNPFWRSVRDLLSTEGDPIHVVLTTRDDAKNGLHCFQFEEPAVFPLRRLEPQDAKQLIQRLAPETVVKNPEKGFTDLVERIVADLGRDHESAILPMQLRVALAGVGNLDGRPLTIATIDRLGGVSALGSFYIERAIRGLDGAWPLVNAMAERTGTGAAKAVLLTESQVAGKVPAGIDANTLLTELEARRIVRRRLDSAETKTWQLYHDYLADAVVALDRRRRKWPLLLAESYEQYRRADGPLQKWSRLLSPSLQIRAYLQRLLDPKFRFGEHIGYVRLSVVRIVFSVWVLLPLTAYAGWFFWNENRQASEIVDAFLQSGDIRAETKALWRLSALNSPRVSRSVFQRLLLTSSGAQRLAVNQMPAIAALGLRVDSLESLRGLWSNEACIHGLLSTCSSFSIVAGDADAFSDHILAQMQKRTDAYSLSSLGNALAALAKEAHGDQAARGADTILAQMPKTTNALYFSFLGKALAALTKEVHGDQAARGADTILAQMPKTTNAPDLSFLGNELAALTKEVHGDQAARLADSILAQMQKTTNAYELSSLGNALAALAKEGHGDQAARGADSILAQMRKTTDDFELSSLGNALAALAAGFPGQPDRSSWIAKLVSVPTSINCTVATANTAREDLNLMVDMLKWPICGGSRDGVMLRIAEAEGKASDAKQFGTFDDPLDRSTFRSDLRKFIEWLRTQTDEKGKHFDIDGPPVHHPS